MPVPGICLGSQLLVTALGGQVRNGLRKEIGWHRVFLESAASDDPLFRDAPPSFETFHWHGDVYDLPPGATRLAHSDLTQCQAYRFGENVSEFYSTWRSPTALFRAWSRLSPVSFWSNTLMLEI